MKLTKTDKAVDAFEKEIKKLLAQGKTPEEAVKLAYEKYPVMEIMEKEINLQLISEMNRGANGAFPLNVLRDATALVWTADKLTLSQRTTKNNKEIIKQAADIIANAIKKGKSVQKTALALFDGYGYGHVLPAQDIPKFMKKLSEIGKLNDYKGREFRKTLRDVERQLKRVNVQGMKIAYGKIKEAIETGNEKKINKAVYVATQERTRYFARRIARTELARAYGDGVMAKWENDEDCVAFQWKLSTGHPFCDICDLHAHADLYGMGPGIFPKDKVPRLPVHPNCMCHLRPVMEGSKLLQGKEKEQIDKGGMTYIKTLDKHDQERLLGVHGRLEVLKSGNWTEKARGYSAGYMQSRIVSEKGITNKRNVGDAIRRIDREYIRSSDFGNKFTRLDNSVEVNKQLKVFARKALFNNDGTTNEDIYFIHAKTGKLLGKIVGYDYAKGASYTRELKEMINRNKGSIVTLHSHPNNNPPTGSDLLSALRHGYKKGYVVTIAGDLHEYELLKKNKEALFAFTWFDNKVARKMNLSYNQNEVGAIKSVLEELFRFVLWREMK